MRSSKPPLARWVPLLPLLAALLALSTHSASAYPLDGYERTGIRRLWAYSEVQRGQLPGPDLSPGARLSTAAIRLQLDGATLPTPQSRPASTAMSERLAGHLTLDGFTAHDLPADPQLQAGLEEIFRRRSSTYSVALLDITNRQHPRYAGVRADSRAAPGSIGKLIVMTGLFDALARAYPDPATRVRVLREVEIVADQFVRSDSHDVPIADPTTGRLEHRRIREGDRFSLYEWIDHMVSPSSNAAASTVWKEAMLLRHFVRQYPPSREQENQFFARVPLPDRRELALRMLAEPLQRAGLRDGDIRVARMFTSRARELVTPDGHSYGSARGLLAWMIALEQGRLVDAWSSLEMKRLLYFTRDRYRYASAPRLENAAVYFKSGSIYSCRSEPGYKCGKYEGTVANIMNSVAIVETPALPAPGQTQRVYLVAMTSNVLRRNSAWDHREIAGEIDRLIESLHP